MEATAPPTDDLTAQREFMSLADAVANCQVKAKKTIVRWAKMEGIRERYGRTGTSTLERVVPLEWVRSKMEERGLNGEPIFEPVELVENVSFTRQDTASPLGSKVPALFQEQETPQLLVFFDRLRQSQEAQAVEVRKFIQESRVGRELIGRAVQEGREEGSREIRKFRRFQGLVNVGLGAGMVLVGVGLSFVIHLGFQLNSSRAEESKSLRKDLGSQISDQGETLRDEMHAVKLTNHSLQSSEERQARELAQVREGIRILREDLMRREDAMVDFFRSRDEEFSEVKAQLQSLLEEKKALTIRLEELKQNEGGPTGSAVPEKIVAHSVD